MSDKQARPKPKWKKGQRFWDRFDGHVEIVGEPFWEPSAQHPEGQWWYPTRIVATDNAKEQELKPVDE